MSFEHEVYYTRIEMQENRRRLKFSSTHKSVMHAIKQLFGVSRKVTIVQCLIPNLTFARASWYFSFFKNKLTHSVFVWLIKYKNANPTFKLVSILGCDLFKNVCKKKHFRGVCFCLHPDKIKTNAQKSDFNKKFQKPIFLFEINRSTDMIWHYDE